MTHNTAPTSMFERRPEFKGIETDRFLREVQFDRSNDALNSKGLRLVVLDRVRCEVLVRTTP